MNETGKNIVEGFRELRKFCNDVASLLQTANGMMEKEGWQYILKKGTTAVYGSQKLDASEEWLPETFFCFYKNESRSNLLPFISVVIGDSVGEVQIDEALITAGWIDYGPGVDAVEKWKKDYSASYLHVWMDSRKKDGNRTDNGRHCTRVTRKNLGDIPTFVRAKRGLS